MSLVRVFISKTLSFGSYSKRPEAFVISGLLLMVNSSNVLSSEINSQESSFSWQLSSLNLFREPEKRRFSNRSWLQSQLTTSSSVKVVRLARTDPTSIHSGETQSLRVSFQQVLERFAAASTVSLYFNGFSRNSVDGFGVIFGFSFCGLPVFGSNVSLNFSNSKLISCWKYSALVFKASAQTENRTAGPLDGSSSSSFSIALTIDPVI